MRGVGGIEVLKQPHQAPWVVAARRADVGSGEVRGGLDVSRITERAQLPDQRDRQQVRASRAEEYRRPDLPPRDLPLLVDQRHRIAVNGVRHLVTNRSGQLFGVLDEVQQRIGHVHIAACGCKGIRLRLVHEIELERMVVSRLGRPRDRGGNRREQIVQRGRRHDFALRLQLVERLLADLLFVIRLFVLCQRRCAATQQECDQKSGDSVEAPCTWPAGHHAILPHASGGLVQRLVHRFTCEGKGRRPAGRPGVPRSASLLAVAGGDLAGDHLPGLCLMHVALNVLHPAVVEHDDECGRVGYQRLLHAVHRVA